MIQQAPQDPLETTDDLCRKELWPVEWEQKMAERIETEKVHAAWNQREFRDKAENFRVLGLINAINANDDTLEKMAKAGDTRIKALEKTVREKDEIIILFFTLRQWDAESGVT